MIDGTIFWATKRQWGLLVCIQNIAVRNKILCQAYIVIKTEKNYDINCTKLFNEIGCIFAIFLEASRVEKCYIPSQSTGQSMHSKDWGNE